MAEDSVEALQWFRERLEWLGRKYPELKATEHQVRLEAELRRQGEGSEHGEEIDREAGGSTGRHADGDSGVSNAVL